MNGGNEEFFSHEKAASSRLIKNRRQNSRMVRWQV